MATLKPFPALRPAPGLAARISAPPYDVVSTEEARALAGDNPYCFLHVGRPEIDLPPGTDSHAPEVYKKGAENFQLLQEAGALRPDAQPQFYLYRQVMGAHAQVGLVAAASCQEYLEGIIKKHELTRVDKEDDRVRHIESLDSQTGPVFLTYRADAAFDHFAAQHIARTPDTDFTAADGVRHTTWPIAAADEIAFVEQTFARIPHLYIADGHHRSAAAARVFQSRQGQGSSARFLAVIFPHDQMQILPYNRVLKDLHGLTPEQLLARLDAVFTLRETSDAKPAHKHELGLYLGDRWRMLTFRSHLTASADPIETLDVTLLQRHILVPLFGIDDPRTSTRINFVGGIRGTAELEKRVNSGEYACAFSMFPTSIEDLMSIADAGGIMPPKSTWFEPKLRDGLFCHMI